MIGEDTCIQSHAVSHWGRPSLRARSSSPSETVMSNRKTAVAIAEATQSSH